MIKTSIKNENVLGPKIDSYRKEIYQKQKLPPEELYIDKMTGKTIWISTTARIKMRKLYNLEHTRNVIINNAIAKSFSSSKPKYSWRVNLRSLKEGEIGHIRFGQGPQGDVWKMIGIEKADRIVVIWLKKV